MARLFPLPLLIFLTLVSVISSDAFAAPKDEENLLEEVVITGAMRVTAGGAQDISYVRSEIAQGRIPHPQGLTAEGLLSEYDLVLESDEPCDQLFCLFYEAVESELVAKPQDTMFVGLGFATNVEADTWQRAPINLIAVVDKSGSMDGAPLVKVKKALTALAKQLNPDDQLSIVLYGDRSHVYLPPTHGGRPNLRGLLQSISQIKSQGSTNMEEGLEVGFDLAYQTQPRFAGKTRLMLFTDERPNVGNTSAGGFIGLTSAASKRDIGMTTIGVGVQFDAALATKISSSRGGNLFFVDSNKAATTLFRDEFDYMVSELAHDLNFSLRAHPHYQITGVYGVPREILNWRDSQTLTFKIPTVFLSKRGGGVFVTLAPAEQFSNLPMPQAAAETKPLSVAITYSGIDDPSPGSDSITIAEVAPKASRPMQIASVLIDNYLLLKSATAAHHVENDQETAYQNMLQLRERMTQIRPRWLRKVLAKEIETSELLFDDLAFLAGHSSEANQSVLADLIGIWEIEKIQGDDSLEFEKGHMWAFGPSWALLSDEFDQKSLDWFDAEECIYTARRLVLPDEDLTSTYKLRRGNLHLNFRDEELSVRLKRVGDLPGEVSTLIIDNP